jgi:hypothetical protein
MPLLEMWVPEAEIWRDRKFVRWAAIWDFVDNANEYM